MLVAPNCNNVSCEVAVVFISVVSRQNAAFQCLCLVLLLKEHALEYKGYGVCVRV